MKSQFLRLPLLILLFCSNFSNIYSQPSMPAVPDPCGKFIANDTLPASTPAPLDNLSSSSLSAVPEANPIHSLLISDFTDKRWNIGQKYLLVITVNGTDPIDDLDAGKIARFFKKYKFVGFQDDSPRVISAENATEKTIQEELTSYILGPDDSLVVYIMAHGEQANGDFRFNVAKEGSMTMSDLIGIFSAKIDPQREKNPKIFVVFDSCHSGKANFTKISKEDYRNIVTITSASEQGEAAFMKNGVKASALSYYLNRALNEDWKIADKDSDGILTYQEAVNYLKIRLKCASKNNEITVDMDPSIDGLNQTEALAFEPVKANNFDSQFWQEFILGQSYAILNERLQSIYGNIHLINNQDYFAKLPILTSKIRKMVMSKHTITASIINERNEVDEKIDNFNSYGNRVEIYNRFLQDKPQSQSGADGGSYVGSVKLLSDNKYKEAIKILIEIEKSDKNQSEQLYMTLGLAQRYTGTLSSATETYDRGLKRFPESTKILLEKASTIVFAEGDTKTKESIKIFSQGVEIELKKYGVLLIDTQKSIESFRSQLDFLKRTGDLVSFNKQIEDLLQKTKTQKPKEILK